MMTTLRLRASGGITLGAAIFLVVTTFGGCDKSNPAGPSPAPCSFALSAQNQSFSSDGGTGTVRVTADAQCAWTVEGATGWVTLVTGAGGTGPGEVTFTVLANSDAAPREKTIAIAKLPFKVSQDARAQCSYSISPEQRTVDDDGGSGEVAVTAADGCGWTAQSHDSWIAITAGGQGQGNGIVKYAVSKNATTAVRKGTLTIAGRTHIVDQEAEAPPAPSDCQYSVSPVTFSPCMGAGTLTAAITTQNACPWTAGPGAAWLTVRSGASGKGSGTVTIAFTDNYDAPRDGVVMIRWPTPSQGQNLHVAQAGCIYGVSRDTISFAAAGGPGTFDVLQQSQPTSCGGATQDRCVWTAESRASWITITSSMPRMGDNPVSFTVAANTGAARTGSIVVRGKTVTITQSAP